MSERDESYSDIPNDEEILKHLKELVREVDIDTMGQKKFIKLLAKKMKVRKLSQKKTFILESLTEILNATDDDSIEDSENSDEGNEQSSDEEEEDDEPEQDSNSDEDEVKARKKRAKKKKKNDNEPKKSNPFNAPKELSAKLANFLGEGSHMSRPQVVKCMWKYIHEHNLQNPENKREILLDDSMKSVFEVEKFTMFQMAKYISAHIYPFTPVKFDTEEEASAKKRKKQEEKLKRKKRAKQNKSPVKRKFALYLLSEPLANLLGRKKLTRQKVIKHLIKYCKDNDLQVRESYYSPNGVFS